MRWAAERGLPVHRAPGPGRGSTYALAEEIDTWFAAARESPARVPAAAPPAATVTAGPPAAIPSFGASWRRRGRIAAALVIGSALLIAIGMLTFHRSRQSAAAPEPVIADTAARAAFLQATYDWNLRTRDSLTRAVDEYGAAIARDPRMPAAYVGLANSYLLLREYGSMPEADAYARAQAAAQAAIVLSPRSPDAHRALAFIAFWWRQDRAEARREFARSIARKPDDALTRHWFATALLANGEAPAALREINIARDLDPTATAILADRGIILYVAGRRAEGLEALHTLAREQPDAVSPHRSLAEIALFEDRADEFLRESATVARLRGDTAGLAEVARWQAAGTGPGVKAAMLRDARGRGANWFRVAQVAALAGRGDEAKDALARACQAREPATISASSSLWLSRALSPADIAQRCGPVSSLS